jgi:hypothetical protein
MYLTAHVLSRVLPPEFTHGQGWPDQVLQLLPGTPVAWWGAAQLGSSSGVMVAVWASEAQALAAADCEGGTLSRVAVSPARAYELDGVELLSGQAAAPGVLQLTWFTGPRTAAHRRADHLADQRVVAALQDLPGLCGALRCTAQDNARVLISFADTEQTLHAALRRIMSTRLGPDEDPALLTGPDAVQICAVVAGTGSLAAAGLTALHGGGVR